MQDKLYGGKIGAFADSMAEEMEKALNEVRFEADMQKLPLGDKDRQMLFIAISRGVINHLKAKEGAFTISTDLPDNHNHNGHTTIQVKPPPDVP